MRKLILWAIIFCLLTFFWAGCGGVGGGSSSSAPAPGAMGTLTVNVAYPDKVIPAGTAYFVIKVFNPGAMDCLIPEVRIDYPETSAVITGIPVGWKLISIVACSANNGRLAYGLFQYNIQPGDNSGVEVDLQPGSGLGHVVEINKFIGYADVTGVITSPEPLVSGSNAQLQFPDSGTQTMTDLGPGGAQASLNYSFGTGTPTFVGYATFWGRGTGSYFETCRQPVSSAVPGNYHFDLSAGTTRDIYDLDCPYDYPGAMPMLQSPPPYQMDGNYYVSGVNFSQPLALTWNSAGSDYGYNVMAAHLPADNRNRLGNEALLQDFTWSSSDLRGMTYNNLNSLPAFIGALPAGTSLTMPANVFPAGTRNVKLDIMAFRKPGLTNGIGAALQISHFSVILNPSIVQVSAVAPTSGPVNTMVTVVGHNFGSTQGSSTVNFNGLSAGQTQTWNDSRITVAVPAGATTGPVTVTVNGQTSNTDHTFTVTVPPPYLLQLTPGSGQVGTAVTLTGQNFGNTQGTSSVTFNSTPAGAALSWNATQIVVYVPSGATSGPVIVTVGGHASNSVNFAVTAPAPYISSLIPAQGQVGTEVTLTGINFGASQEVACRVLFDGLGAGSYPVWSASRIICTVPVGANSGMVTVNVNGQVSNGVNFTVLPPSPVITALNPAQGYVGTPVTISGSHFGASQGSSTITFNGQNAGTASSWNDSAIIIYVPAGASSGPVVVTVNAQASNGYNFMVKLPPHINTIYPVAGYAGVTVVTVSGTGFGSSRSRTMLSVVTFNDIPADNYSLWTDTEIRCVVPTNATSGYLQVTVYDPISGEPIPSNSVSFTVLAPAPVISGINPPQGPVGIWVTLAGSHFGNLQASSTVSFNGSDAGIAQLWYDTQIIVMVPYAATSGAVVVTVNDQPSNAYQFNVMERIWNWDNPLPAGNMLNALWGSSPTNIYAAGKTGTLLHYNGTTWGVIENPFKVDLNGLWGSAANDVFAVGQSGTILHFNGSNWNLMDISTSVDFQSVWGTAANNVYAEGSMGPQTFIYRYNGTAWSEFYSFASDSAGGIWGSGANDIYALGYDGLPVIYHYNGTSWSSTALASGTYLNGIAGYSASDIYAVGYDQDNYQSLIMHYNGTNWSVDGRSFRSRPDADLFGVWVNGPADVFAVGASGTVLHFNGSTWQEQPSETYNDLYGGWGAYAAGDYGTLLRYNGTVWQPENSTLTINNLYDGWAASYNDLYVAGDYGDLLHFNGSTWSLINTGYYDSYLGIWGSAPNDIFLVGYEGAVIHYNGSTWDRMYPGTSAYLRDVWGTASNNVYAAGQGGTLLHYNGGAWTINSQGQNDLNALWGWTAENIYAVGSSGTILHSNDGNTWLSQSSGTSAYLSSIWGSGPADIFAVGDSGTILHYNGSTWNAMSSGTSEHLAKVWGRAPHDVYAVGARGMILHYDGSYWMPLSQITGNWLFGIFGTMGSPVYVVGEYGTVLHY